MEKFENVDYNELGFDPRIYGLFTSTCNSSLNSLNSFKDPCGHFLKAWPYQ
ncbi:hypothetical protein Syun_031180 [Stephania yunnanensis]|uniref:Uncharacterized protein n=1 Tax=Stephania yunnanensis TaxID=152371 RepID=A0AAP0HBS0_9MAGN